MYFSSRELQPLLLTKLKKGQMVNMPYAFPFHCTVDMRGRVHSSTQSYEFEEPVYERDSALFRFEAETLTWKVFWTYTSSMLKSSVRKSSLKGK
jgi:hypothetical protein